MALGVRTLARDFRRFRNWKEIHGKRSNLWKVRSPRIDVLLRDGTTDGWIAREILFDRVYTRYFDVQRGDVVLDIGAHIGLFSLYAHAKGASQVFAFEPNPMNFEALTNNVLLNNARNIHAFRIAVLPGFHSTTFHIPSGKSKDRSSAFEIVKESHNDILVDCISLDEFIGQNKLSRIDFLKLDAEGSEYDILAKTKSLDIVEKVALEAHELKGHNRQEASDLLQERGFHFKANDAPTDGLASYMYGWR
jgi:FkbM family methyltransferase